MQIVCVSRGTQTGGVQLAERLAGRLGCDCIAREDLTDAATRAGIPVGKLEMAALRRRPLSEQMALEKERFKAFVTATLCERALREGLVYHGRTGHTALPGVSNILRVRAIMDPESRIAAVMERMRLSRRKAREYIEQVDQDRNRWIRSLYNLDWVDPENYDTVVNLSHMSADNAAAALVAMAALPEFQTTPATVRSLSDLSLAARCRLALGAHQQTRGMDVKVRVDGGQVSVTYLPRDSRAAEVIPEVLRDVEGANEILCTMASANLLWIQERFNPDSPAIGQILDIAGKWNAAIEVVRLTEGGEAAVPGDEARREAGVEITATGGILDDSSGESEEVEDEGFRRTRGRLIAAGRAGGHLVISGGAKDIINRLDRTAPYSLVVVGDVFLGKTASVRKRLSREMVSYLSDNLRVPVIESQEMRTQYLFGPRQWLALLRYGAIAAVLVALVFSHQLEVLTFTSEPGLKHRILSTACIFLLVPIFAHAYGNFARYVLRLLRFE
jgi:cytidylate kinase